MMNIYSYTLLVIMILLGIFSNRKLKRLQRLAKDIMMLGIQGNYSRKSVLLCTWLVGHGTVSHHPNEFGGHDFLEQNIYPNYYMELWQVCNRQLQYVVVICRSIQVVQVVYISIEIHFSTFKIVWQAMVWFSCNLCLFPTLIQS